MSSGTLLLLYVIAFPSFAVAYQNVTIRADFIIRNFTLNGSKGEPFWHNNFHDPLMNYYYYRVSSKQEILWLMNYHLTIYLS